MLRRGNHVLWRWGPALVWMLVIFILSAQPSYTYPSVGTVAQKTVHVVEYGVLAILLWRALAVSSRHGLSPWVSAWLIATLYGASDEFHQLFVLGRHGQIIDVGVDALGAALALAVLALRQRLFERAGEHLVQSHQREGRG